MKQEDYKKFFAKNKQKLTNGEINTTKLEQTLNEFRVFEIKLKDSDNRNKAY